MLCNNSDIYSCVKSISIDKHASRDSADSHFATYNCANFIFINCWRMLYYSIKANSKSETNDGTSHQFQRYSVQCAVCTHPCRISFLICMKLAMMGASVESTRVVRVMAIHAISSYSQEKPSVTHSHIRRGTQTSFIHDFHGWIRYALNETHELTIDTHTDRQFGQNTFRMSLELWLVLRACIAHKQAVRFILNCLFRLPAHDLYNRYRRTGTHTHTHTFGGWVIWPEAFSRIVNRHTHTLCMHAMGVMRASIHITHNSHPFCCLLLMLAATAASGIDQQWTGMVWCTRFEPKQLPNSCINQLVSRSWRARVVSHPSSAYTNDPKPPTVDIRNVCIGVLNSFKTRAAATTQFRVVDNWQ